MKIKNPLYSDKLTGRGTPIPVTRLGSDEVDINTLIGHMVDRRRDAIYDRVRLKAGLVVPLVLKCFQVPVGQADPFDSLHVRTFADTNMLCSGQLAPPYDMVVQRILFLFQPTCSERDRNRMAADYWWDFKLQEKSQNRHPMLVSAAVGKPEDIIKNFGKTPTIPEPPVSNIDLLGEGVCWDLKDRARYIPPLVQFTLLIQGQPFQLKADLDFYVFLDGLRDYPVS